MKIIGYAIFVISLLTLNLNTGYSSPLIMVGDYVNVLFDGSSALVWQSNIFYDDKEEENELMLLIAPGFEASIGSPSSRFEAIIRGNYEIQRFEELFDLNDEYVHVSAVGSYDGARLDLDAAYSFDEEQTTAGEQGTSGSQFIEMDITRAHFMGAYILSPKFSLESGVRYDDREFKEFKDRLADVESFSIPVDVFYELTPKVDLSVGYEYTLEEVGRSSIEDFHRESNFVNIGARGNLFPKLDGFFKIGFRNVNPEGPQRETDSSLGLDADFTYLMTPKLKSKLHLHRRFEVGSEAQSVESTAAKLDMEYIISGNYLANAYTDLVYNDFKDGNDGVDFIKRLGMRLSYLPNQYWRFSTGYAYVENDSNRLQQGYKNHILDVSASLRY